MGENIITSIHHLKDLKKSAAVHVADIKVGPPNTGEILLPQQVKCELIIMPFESGPLISERTNIEKIYIIWYVTVMQIIRGFPLKRKQSSRY